MLGLLRFGRVQGGVYFGWVVQRAFRVGVCLGQRRQEAAGHSAPLQVSFRVISVGGVRLFLALRPRCHAAITNTGVEKGAPRFFEVCSTVPLVV